MSAGQVSQRLQDLETVVVKQLDRAVSKVQNGIALCWTTVTTTIGQMVDTRVLGKVDKWNSSGKAWPKWSFVMKAGAEISTDVVSNVQLGGVQLYVVLIMLRTGRDWNRIANASQKLEYGSVAISLPDVFPEERRKVVCADDGGTGSFVGHERCGGRSLRHNGRRRDLFKITQRCFREFWKKQGLRFRVLVSRVR